MNTHATLPAALAALALLACVDESSAKRGFPYGAGDFLIADAASHDLASLQATVLDVRLVKASGKDGSKNLLPGPRRVELVGQDEVPAWLDISTLPLGKYAGLRVTFATDDMVARAKDGTELVVTVAGPVLEQVFETTLEVERSDYDRVLIDVDLAESLSGDVGSGLTFDAQGDLWHDDGGVFRTIDELRGTVTTFLPGNSVYVLAGVDDDGESPLGVVRAYVSSSTHMYGVDQVPYPTADAFFDDLVAGETVLEVYGDISLVGVVTAKSIHVVGQNGAPQNPGEVRLEGHVVGHATDELDLQWTRIESGADVAQPVLDSLGNPLVISASAPAAEFLLTNANGEVTSKSTLDVGMRLEVTYSVFDGVDFVVSRARVLREPAGEVTLVSTAGLPNFAQVHVDAFEPWVVSGEVVDDQTDVQLTLSSAQIYVDTRTRPKITANELRTGLRAQALGALNQPLQRIDGKRVLVRPGRLVGRVTGTTPPSTFTVALTSFYEPFGGDVDESGPYTVQIDADCDLTGDADTPQQLLDLFDALGAGETLRVEVQGLAATAANEIQAFELDVRRLTP